MMIKLGFSNSTYTTWKKRGTSPKVDDLAKIADYFGVSVDYLLGRESSAAGMELSPEEEELVLCYRSASADERTIVDLTLRKHRVTPTAPIEKDA